jgi:uncharacterized protein YoxC
MILNMVVVIALAIVLFLCFIFGFRYGVKLGQQASKGTLPPVKGPVKAIKQSQEANEIGKANKQLLKDINALIGYTGDEIAGNKE